MSLAPRNLVPFEPQRTLCDVSVFRGTPVRGVREAPVVFCFT